MADTSATETGLKPYVRVDGGVMRVGNAGVMLEAIVAAFELGDSAESIRSQYPGLSLEEVYGAIAFYLGHRPAVAEYLQRQDEVWRHWRSKFEENPSPLLQKLRALQGKTARGTS